MTEITISREDDARGGRWIGRIAGVAEEAELVFDRVAADLVAATHTFVPETMRGTGMGRLLIDRMLADARAEGFAVVPRCSFVKAQYARHPEWSDVMRE